MGRLARRCSISRADCHLFVGVILLHLFRQSTIVDAEMVSLSFSLLATAVLLSPHEKPGVAFLIVAGFLFMLGALSKLLVCPMILPIILLMAPKQATLTNTYSGIQKGRSFCRYWLVSILFFGLGCFICGAIFLMPYNLPAMYDQLIGIRFVARSRYPRRWVGNLKDVFNFFNDDPIWLALSVPGFFILYWKRRRTALWLSSWILAASIFLLDHRPLFSRHAVLLLPPIAVAAGGSVLWIPLLLTSKTCKSIGVIVVVLILVILGFMVRRDVKLVLKKAGTPALEQKVIRFIQENSQPSDLVISDEQMQVFRAGRRIPPEHCENGFVRIKTGYLTNKVAIEASKNAKIIIFSTDRLIQLDEYTKWVESHFRLVPEFKNSHVRVFLQGSSLGRGGPP